MTKYILILTTILGCHIVTDEINESFNTVLKSLDKSNQSQIEKFTNKYDSISLNRSKNKDLSNKADTISLQLHKTIEYIDKIRNELKMKDSTGRNLKVSSKILINSKEGKELCCHLNQFFKIAKDNSISQNTSKQIDVISIHYPEKISSNKWLELNFKNTQSIAAITILSKYKNDCISAGELILSDIKKEIMK